MAALCQPRMSSRDLLLIHGSNHKDAVAPSTMTLVNKLAAFCLHLSISFIVTEKILFIARDRWLDLDWVYLSLIQSDHKHFLVSRVQLSLSIDVDLRSASFLRPIPPSFLGLHKISHEILCVFNPQKMLEQRVSIFCGTRRVSGR